MTGRVLFPGMDNHSVKPKRRNTLLSKAVPRKGYGAMAGVFGHLFPERWRMNGVQASRLRRTAVSFNAGSIRF